MVGVRNQSRVEELLRMISENREREAWMFVRGLSEEDVYGRHAAERYTEEGESLARWIVMPKGMVFAVDVGGSPKGPKSKVLARDPNYVGEHRATEGHAS